MDIATGVINAHFRDWLPPSWLEDSSISTLWVIAYRALRVTQKELSQGPVWLDLDESRIRAVLAFGKLRYQQNGDACFRINTDNQLEYLTEDLSLKDSDEEAYMIFFLPAEQSATEREHELLRSKISSYVGLLIAINGRNMVYQKLFENLWGKTSGKMMLDTRFEQHPTSFPKPLVSQNRLRFIADADKALLNQEPARRNRVFTSLRWFNAALFPADPHILDAVDISQDSYLKYWLALETLIMEDATNINSIQNSLARAYGTEVSESPDPFEVEVLFLIRRQLVYQGVGIPLHFEVLRYMEALYTDVLYEVLGLPCEKRSAYVMMNSNDRKFSLNKFLQSLREQ